MLLHDASVVDCLAHGRLAGLADGRVAGRRPEQGWAMRLSERLRSHALDRALSDGADPAATRQLAAHASLITTPAMRAELAESLERLARTEHEPTTYRRVVPFRRAIRANATELRALAALLRGSTPVRARGVAMLRALVTDGTGPAYTDRDGGALAGRLSSARSAAAG